ncbi:MAG: hypothetical protein BWY35_00117 [Firmicutes bacterium ADurb.Bin248]|nr:MAG: hypothetical protein BWY35_00117 [Firmicutes bacterium ADurb.Bin248]HPK15742.1 GNAT family N-acetyltransferase [Clostridia bacterium]
MSLITTHDVTLYGGNGVDLVLRPLCDGHLPLLYKWNADPEVVYWTDTGNAQVFSEEDIRGIYASISQNALCFLAEVDGRPVGDFWIQRMNVPEVSAKYPGLDVRRIEATIGERSSWGQGIGTAILGMLIDFAFCGEHVDMLYCFAADYNIRSQKSLLKQGFVPAGESDADAGSLRAKKEYHYRLTRREFIGRRRERIPKSRRFETPLIGLQPSQLWISEGKLRLVREWFDPARRESFDPIPVKRLGGRILMTDGHTRAVAAHLAGWESVPVYWDEDELDMRAYAADVAWCDGEGILSPVDLAARIVPHRDYERLWRKRCMEMKLD